MDATLASAVDARVWTRGEIGVLLFLAGEVMLFAGLISAAIVLRADDPRWGSGAAHLSIGVGFVATALLASASGVLAFALARARRASGNAARASLRAACLVSALLGAAFLALQAFEYRELLAHGLSWRSGVFGSCFFTLTAVHGLHVFGGVAWLALCGLCAPRDVTRVSPGDVTRVSPRDVTRVRTASWYWHLVDGVWLALLCFFYLA